MFQILKYLILIRFRKIFAKDDFLAISIFVVAIIGFMYLFQENLNKYVFYLGLFPMQIFALQIERKDIEFLKLNPNFRIILFLEYIFLSSPILILLIYNLKLVSVFGVILSVFGITFINKPHSKTLKYPFKMFDPFWTISFRKYKLIWVILVLLFIAFMGFKYHNQNLEYAILLIAGIILCVASSEREKLHFIKASSFIGKEYLFEQIKTILYNSIFVLIPILIVFLVLKQFQILLFIPLLLLLPIVNLLFKYVFFERKLIHNLFFAFFIGNLIYGFPLLFIPVLYSKSIKNLKRIQNA